jgi:hypothetical protein
MSQKSSATAVPTCSVACYVICYGEGLVADTWQRPRTVHDATLFSPGALSVRPRDVITGRFHARIHMTSGARRRISDVCSFHMRTA